MKVADALTKMEKGYDHAVLVFLDAAGYPVSVATDYRVDAERGVLTLKAPAGEKAAPSGGEVNVIVSHIHPAPGIGYDQRRYVQVWGRARRDGDTIEVTPRRAQSWDEKELPFFQYNEVSVPQGQHYLEVISAQHGQEVKPKLSKGWLFLRATRLPFLTATLVPVLVGVAAAAADGFFDLSLAVLTFFGAAFIHLGLNVANDIFDTMSGADAANTTPTQFSGGSRVVHYGLMSLRSLVIMSASFYLAGIAIGFYLAITRGFLPLFWLGIAGVVISIVYTAPPFRLVHRGLGEIAVALGFGPIMVLGSFYVQAQRFTAEAAYLSAPVAILIALVLFMNEIPDRAGDALAGKRTLAVRMGRRGVLTTYGASVALTYVLIAAGAISGLLARPSIIALATIPLAINAFKGFRSSFEDPYGLMPAMAKNIQLHLFTGLLLFAGYLIAIIVGNVLSNPPAFLV